jgi:hypothetical protein
MAARKPHKSRPVPVPRGTRAELAIHLPGGLLIVPGRAKTDRGIAALVVRALAKGTARVQAKSE